MQRTAKSFLNEQDALQWLCSNKVNWDLETGNKQYWLRASWPGGEFQRLWKADEKPPGMTETEWVEFNKGAAVIDVQLRLSKQYADRNGYDWWRDRRGVQAT